MTQDRWLGLCAILALAGLLLLVIVYACTP